MLFLNRTRDGLAAIAVVVVVAAVVVFFLSTGSIIRVFSEVQIGSGFWRQKSQQLKSFRSQKKTLFRFRSDDFLLSLSLLSHLSRALSRSLLSHSNSLQVLRSKVEANWIARRV